ncbi:MAG: hypothetical protein IPL78_03820 [Chloroflexi bacterium]|nr:hypothetical protein [Chloroflexota bacterium]
MFDKISNSWRLVKASAAVLSADKELMIFPIISAIGTIIVTLTFAFPLFLSGLIDSMLGGAGQIVGIIVLFLFYMVQYFVIFFCNTALVGAALIRLNGGDPTVGDGFRIALKHAPSILGYALISATVGMILRWLSERGGMLGRIVVSLIGFAWNIATYLVVPVLVVEEVGPVEAIKRSAGLLRKTWGEQLVGNFGLGAVFGLITFGLILLMIPLIVVAAALENFVLIIGVIVLFVMGFVLLGLVNSALSGIYAAAVYNYAANGKTGDFFDPAIIKNAFRSK